MNNFTKETVDSLANKLLIGLTEEENKMVLEEFNIIDKTCDMVNKIPNISDVEPKTHALEDFYVEMREDVSKPSVKIEDLLSNCDEVSDRSVELPKVVG